MFDPITRFQTFTKHWIYVSELGASRCHPLGVNMMKANREKFDRQNFQPLSPLCYNCPNILTISGQTVVFWSLNSNLQSKVVLVQAWRCAGVEMHSLNSALDQVSGQLYTPATLPPGGKKCLVASEEGAGWGPEPGWTIGRWQNSLAPCQKLNENLQLSSLWPSHYTNHIIIPPTHKQYTH